ncbi:NAD(P)-dependent oxidoreductase [Comamonas endophytica]|uniref:NAD(P)-dependent oxidoreductase n=1 Tax=Comamonas endophytica TaxID=2949090 RepID=A0ABY6GEV0_9BURK|nr:MULTISPECIES: NAD(P)-dependent oxidoreductase [unclassified Acidovorax]MCD2514331.1 NAD(P)-dependent oxidoreductase [Acidovorax sp. D4N7]UYG53580.1 NAD(P)-dependent oxidoreductase [Acidovorax sp. 5MLIR]UYG53624.1 NAD(P)-dependent oxidoreductase [Acidovorax sp. 5MLIR]
MSRIGFIGLGMMGRPMAHLLHAAGHTLVVQDANQEVAAGFAAEHPQTLVANAAQEFAGCDAVITMLPNSDIVDAVVQGLQPHLRRGACVIEMSSADPNRTRALAARLQEQGVALIDAPVSGGVKKAVAGTLAIMVGGDAQVFAQQKPVLECLGKAITYVGPVGAGHALKALNNYVSAAALLATAEAIHVGAAFGIEAATIVDVINASTGRNNTTENKAHQFMLNGAFDSGFSLALQAKDVGIAAALGSSVQLPMELAQKVHAMTADASQALGPKADHTELYKFVGRA